MIRRIDGLVLSDEGPSGNGGGEPLVLLHGFTGSKDSWRELRAYWREFGRVLAIDLPGHGATDVDGLSMEETTARILAALRELRVGHFTLLGYSMGGRQALHIALEAGTRLRRLLVESGSAGIEDPAERRNRAEADEVLAEQIERDGIEAFVRYWEGRPLFRSQAGLSDAARERQRRERLACSPAGLAASLRSAGTGVQPWLGERIRSLDVPVLFVVGEEDSKFRDIARDLSGRIRDSRVRVVPGAGHAPHLEQPEVFHRIAAEFFRGDPE